MVTGDMIPMSQLPALCCTLRLTQLCSSDVARRKRFHDRALRAGKGKVIAELESQNHVP